MLISNLFFHLQLQLQLQQPIKLPYLIKQPNFKPSFKNLPSQIIVFLPLHLLICQSLLIWMIPW